MLRVVGGGRGGRGRRRDMGEEVVKAGRGKEREVWRGELEREGRGGEDEGPEESQPGWGLAYFWKRWAPLSFLVRHGV